MQIISTGTLRMLGAVSASLVAALVCACSSAVGPGFAQSVASIGNVSGSVAPVATGSSKRSAATVVVAIDSSRLAAPRGTGTSAATPIVLEDFSTYKSTADFLANPRGIWVDEGKDKAHIALDQSVGAGGSTQSMRYDFPNVGSVCQDHSINPGFLKIPNNPTHVWVEFVVRFSSNFTVDAGRSDCGKEYKLAALGDYYGGIGRWNLPEMQAGRFVTGYPGNDAGFSSNFSTAQLWDGQPHVFHIEAALSSSNTGVFKFWVDGKLLVNQSGFSTSATHKSINIFGPGLNINQGPAVNGMKVWWHRIAVYSANPGWQ
jgi:hypothetical protein